MNDCLAQDSTFVVNSFSGNFSGDSLCLSQINSCWSSCVNVIYLHVFWKNIGLFNLVLRATYLVTVKDNSDKNSPEVDGSEHRESLSDEFVFRPKRRQNLVISVNDEKNFQFYKHISLKITFLLLKLFKIYKDYTYMKKNSVYKFECLPLTGYTFNNSWCEMCRKVFRYFNCDRRVSGL